MNKKIERNETKCNKTENAMKQIKPEGKKIKTKVFLTCLLSTSFNRNFKNIFVYSNKFRYILTPKTFVYLLVLVSLTNVYSLLRENTPMQFE